VRQTEEQKLEEEIKKYDQEKISSPQPLEKSFSLMKNDRGELEKVEDLSPRWLKKYDFVAFFPEDNGNLICTPVKKKNNLQLANRKRWRYCAINRRCNWLVETQI